MLKTNRAHLPVIAVGGGVAVSDAFMLVRDPDGYEHARVNGGGIVYNCKLGDNAYSIVGEHVVPCVSARAMDKSNFDSFACIGNKAIVAMGAAANAEGFVMGKLSGKKVSLWFPDDVISKLRLSDQFLVYSCGVGLQLMDHPEIAVINIDPDLLEKLNIVEDGEKLTVPVTATVPGVLMGAGVGMPVLSHTGDYDITVSDKAAVAQYGLDKLRFGDLVMITDYDMTKGSAYTEGAVSVCVVVHSGSIQTGHGIGVVPVLSSKKPLIEAKINADANIGCYMGAC